VQSNDTENEDDGQRHDDDGVDLETGRLVSVQPWVNGLACSVQQQSQRRAACGMQPSADLSPMGYSLSMVLELPPAPAALVLLGRWFETFSARSAAAFLRMTVAGPPGGLGDAGRAVVVPDAALFEGEVARGED
jgi:hypothetical protein